MTLRHEVLVTDHAWMDHRRAADELPGILGHVVLENFVDERVSAVDGLLERSAVGERAAEVRQTTLDLARVRLEKTRGKVERERERVHQSG